MDRIDIHIEVTPVKFNELVEESNSERSNKVRDRVIKARQIQEKRYEGIEEVYCNAQIKSKQLKDHCQLTPEGISLLKKAMERLGLSARAFDRILKVSRTIADLSESTDIKTEHLSEAIQYRSLDREGWGN